MTRKSVFAGWVVGLTLSSVGWGQSQPSGSNVPAPGRMEAAGGPPITQNGDPYLMNPGHYVVPRPDTPDYWSPHLRPFPDYSYERTPFSAPNTRMATPFRNYGRQPAFTFGPGLVGGDAYAAPFYGDTASAYNQGRYDADREYNWFLASQRAGRLLNQYSAMFDLGMQEFREGRYERAVVNWLGAAESNQSNAASRLHAGHAMFALGRYAEGVRQIARAFELSPGLAYKTYDIRDEYGDRTDFDEQLAALRSHVSRNPDDPAGMTMLGYVAFHTLGPGPALPILERAARLDPAGFFIPKLLNIARQASPTLKQDRSTTASKSKAKGRKIRKPRKSIPAWGV